MAFTKDERKMIDGIKEDQTEIKVDIAEIKTVLVGKNSDKGLVGLVADTVKKVSQNRVAIVAMASSGLLGGGITGLVKWLG